MRPADHAARERALDPAGSFIVQAPAGSGKTELLIQRYLRLLAGVEQPESVVAITFTKKAAAEMRRRVLKALEQANSAEEAEAHERKTRELARAVAARDAEKGWELAKNPRRLSIRTIDSLCSSLVARMPWLSRLGPRLEPLDHAAELYREAAQRTVDRLEEDEYGDAIEPLLRHVDNKQDRLVRLLAEMLARRDQWLRHVASADHEELRESIEQALRGEIEGLLKPLRDAMPRIVEDNAVELLRHAAENLRDSDKHTEIQACGDIQKLPAAKAEDLPAWRALADLLLKQDGKPRRSVDKRNGFPTESPFKPLMIEVVEALDGDDPFCKGLAEVPDLPDAQFDEAQWAVLEAMLEALPRAAEELRGVFAERGQVDFAALTEAALEALGEDHLPTDLAFALDHRIEHLLVDEFQDTSHSQMELLRKLTREWSAGDNRTVFLVGDPMQSIYRFREAEVGLFLRTVRHGLPAVEMEALTLSVNFRSLPNIVDWVNGVFPGVFAEEEDVALGAVRFSPSECASREAPGPAVEVHPFFSPADKESEDRSTAHEADAIARIARAARQRGESVAILARARTHLPPILQKLRAEGLRYSAVEIDPLGASSPVQDLMALTAALLHPGDRVSWLSILRAPWCGLSLADLHALAGDAPKAAVPDLLADAARLARLGAAGRVGVERLQRALRARRPRTLRAWVEGVWLRLGGPATIEKESGLDDADAYFDLLDTLDEGCDVDLDRLAAGVGRLFAAPDPSAAEDVQVMTIHKAKGLEFDVVILPGLGRAPRGEASKLMLWLERPARDGIGMESPLLAPIKSAAVKSDAIYRYVQRLERSKGEHEMARLLYVAATRARRELHLLGTAKVKDGEATEPGKRTLLGLLWGAVGERFHTALRESPDEAPSKPEPPPRLLRRLASDWVPPRFAAEPAAEASVAEEAPRRYRWAAQKRRLIGNVVHDMLQEVSREGAGSWSAERVRAQRLRFGRALRAAGALEDDLDGMIAEIERAVLRTLEDERGRWILDAGHQDARSEVPLAGLVDGEVVERRIDRTFIDANGVRWIVDFKTTPKKKGDPSAVVARQMERYRQQMEEYRALYRRMEDRPVRIGLYFPLLGEWREYEEAGGASV